MPTSVIDLATGVTGQAAKGMWYGTKGAFGLTWNVALPAALLTLAWQG